MRAALLLRWPGPSRARLVLLARVALLALLVLGWQVALSPGKGDPPWFEHADKLQHAVAFAGYAVLVLASRLNPHGAGLLALLAYGAAIEWAQSRIPGRDASWADLMADAVGIALGLLSWNIARTMIDGAARHAAPASSVALTPENQTPPADPS